MAIKITLTANAQTGDGVDFNADFAAFFQDFEPYNYPLMLNPTGSDNTTQIVHLDTPVAGHEANTKALVLNGANFVYTFSNHSVSGRIDSLQLVTLGDAWNPNTNDVRYQDGLLSPNTTGLISFSNLNITNPVGLKGRVHEIVKEFMGGGPDGNKAGTAAITKEIWAKAHILVGSTGDDRYLGSKFGDNVKGNGGEDHLNGRAGNDTIIGGAADDRLIGAAGNDRLVAGPGDDTMSGGAGADRFVFVSMDEDAHHTITDVKTGQKDKIDLRALDANVNKTGDQAFAFKGQAAFSSKAGELVFAKSGTSLVLQGDIDGDGLADFSITLNNLATLRAADLFL
jgi:Ca2+-binding RTX toxin-like protein